MRIAVTGGMGFIGQELVAKLLDLNEVIVVDNWRSLLARYESSRYPILDGTYKNLSRAVSLVDPADFLTNMKKLLPEVIVHLGAIVDTKDLGSDRLFTENVGYTQELARLCSEFGIHLIFASSGAVYGSRGYPNNPYGLTKSLAEKAVNSCKTRTINLRFFNVFGRNEHHKGTMASVPFKLAQAYMNGDKFEMHSPDASRDFVSVDSVVMAIVSIANSFRGPKMTADIQAYDVGTGVATTYQDLDNFIMQATGNITSCVKFIDIPEEIAGRFQGYTCAGKMPGSPLNFWGSDPLSTRNDIERIYGRH